MRANGGFLAVDAGNTRLKATYLPDDPHYFPEAIAVDSDNSEALMDHIERFMSYGRLSCAMAVTGKFDVRLAETLRLKIGDSFMVLTPATELPIRINYRSPETLGLDRKATACAASALYPSERLVIVDAGTALTIDFVDRNGFNGGNISPGLRMRFRSLHDYTARLPLITELPKKIPIFGQDTNEAISAGVFNGWRDEVAGTLTVSAALGYNKVLLTGGDAPLLMESLPETLERLGRKEIKIEYHPHLLAEGMRTIYRHHENKN